MYEVQCAVFGVLPCLFHQVWCKCSCLCGTLEVTDVRCFWLVFWHLFIVVAMNHTVLVQQTRSFRV